MSTTVQPCGHPAAAYIDDAGYGYCGACAVAAAQALPPAQPSRLVPSWATVAPLLARWQMALVPHRDGQWDVLAGFVAYWMPHHEARRVPFAGLPQAIWDMAARCEAAAGEGGR